jgi:hypothetical protein
VDYLRSRQQSVSIGSWWDKIHREARHLHQLGVGKMTRNSLILLGNAPHQSDNSQLCQLGPGPDPVPLHPAGPPSSDFHPYPPGRYSSSHICE